MNFFFFQASLFELLKLKVYCDDHLSISYTSAVHIQYIEHKSRKLLITDATNDLV